MSDNIPYEIQLEIIKKVPDVKSLVRFRSVSKPWKSFIDSPEFVAAYGARDTQPHSLLLRYRNIFYWNYEFTQFRSIYPREVKYVSFVDDVSFPQQQLNFAPNVPDLIKQFKYSYLEVIGSSCGLWGLSGYRTESTDTDAVVIWNPSIRKLVGTVVPFVLTSSSNKVTHFGFGVCPSTYDPTIVGMSRKNKHNLTWKVGIFTLSSKTWKMIPSSNVPRESITVRSSTQVAIDRFIFWVAYNERFVANDGESEFKNLILSFDLIIHEYKEVNLPVSIANEVSLDISISMLNESLVVSAYTFEVNDGLVYGVWMMGEEGGAVTSFTKLFNIKTPDDSAPVSKVLGFTMSGEPIMETEKANGEFATAEVYKPCSEHIDDLGIYGEKDSFFICHYKETLLLADHSGCFTIYQ